MAHDTVSTNGSLDLVKSAFRILEDERDNLHALASAITDRLSRKDEGGEIVDFVGSRLGLMLEEMLGDLKTIHRARDMMIEASRGKSRGAA